MGYYSRLSGSLDLSRELTHAELRAMPKSEFSDLWLFKFDVFEDEEDTDHGIVVVQSADSIVPAVEEGEGTKVYEAILQLQKLVNMLPIDVEVSGHIRREGERSPDVGRYVVTKVRGNERKVIEEEPRLVWPDGTSEPVRP